MHEVDRLALGGAKGSGPCWHVVRNQRNREVNYYLDYYLLPNVLRHSRTDVEIAKSY